MADKPTHVLVPIEWIELHLKRNDNLLDSDTGNKHARSSAMGRNALLRQIKTMERLNPSTIQARVKELTDALKKIEQMSDCGSAEQTIIEMKRIASKALNQQ